jgi:hypothetical protein
MYESVLKDSDNQIVVYRDPFISLFYKADRSSGLSFPEDNSI